MVILNSYPVGETVQLACKFYDASMNAIDPTSVILFVSSPNGTVNQYAPQRSNVGSYFYNYLVATPGGKWYYRFNGIGTTINVSSGDIPFTVQLPKF